MRARILRGAAEAIGALGYGPARVEDIIHAAAVSRPTFYKVFQSKEDVLEALSAQHHREIRKRIVRAHQASDDPVEKLRATVEAFLRWRAELGPIGRILDVEARTPGSSIAHHRERTLREMTQLTADSLRAAGRPPVDPVMLYSLIAVLESIADQLLARPPVGEAAVQRALENAVRVLAGALALPGDPVPPLPPPPARKAKRRQS